MQHEVWDDFKSLPAEAQRQVADFIAFLRQRCHHPARGRRCSRDWENEPFMGMWRDREELEDSSTWVRRTREQEGVCS